MSETLDYCGLIGCWRPLVQKGRGRRRDYCCDEHRREARNMRREAEARIARFSELIRRDQHLLAALGVCPVHRNEPEEAS